MPACRKCNLDHGRLGVRIEGNTLFRSNANKASHMIHKNGGAWAFEAALLSRHPEIDYIIVTATTGEMWQVDRRTFDRHAYTETASGRPQSALHLNHWRTSDELEHNEPDAEAVQPFLLDVKPPTDTFYERARKPRPRIEPKRRRWG
jgi:hypothetical protein